MNIVISLLNFYRVKEWFYHLGFVYLGMVYVSGAIVPPVERMIIGFFMGSLYLGGGYSYNRVCDVARPKKSESALALLSLIVFLPLNFIFYKRCLIFFLIAIPLSIVYSHPKILFKKYHFVSIMVNGYLFGILFLFGCVVGGAPQLSIDVLLLTLLFCTIMLAYQIIHEMSHFVEDNVAHNKKIIQKYVRELYVCLLCISVIVGVIYYILGMNNLFALSSYAFILVFFCVVNSIARSHFDVRIVKKKREILRNVGIIYGTVLCFIFLCVR
ncbi:MAG: UbiA family prenyltransferase [Candidatus Omnitrophica bacterium]|nr:UbiA family prenyltransferase [Candidatus Omnitrophota bacterium]